LIPTEISFSQLQSANVEPVDIIVVHNNHNGLQRLMSAECLTTWNNQEKY